MRDDQALYTPGSCLESTNLENCVIVIHLPIDKLMWMVIDVLHNTSDGHAAVVLSGCIECAGLS